MPFVKSEPENEVRNQKVASSRNPKSEIRNRNESEMNPVEGNGFSRAVKGLKKCGL